MMHASLSHTAVAACQSPPVHPHAGSSDAAWSSRSRDTERLPLRTCDREVFAKAALLHWIHNHAHSIGTAA